MGGRRGTGAAISGRVLLGRFKKMLWERQGGMTASNVGLHLISSKYDECQPHPGIHEQPLQKRWPCANFHKWGSGQTVPPSRTSLLGSFKQPDGDGAAGLGLVMRMLPEKDLGLESPVTLDSEHILGKLVTTSKKASPCSWALRSHCDCPVYKCFSVDHAPARSKPHWGGGGGGGACGG